MEEQDCISRFFHKNSNAKIKDSSRIPTSPLRSLDSSHDLSQTSSLHSDEELSLSQLTMEEKEPLHVVPYFNITPREMPISPHYIFEEEFSSNPWAMLIATIFLTKTSGRTARPYMKSFFEEYPTPYHVLSQNPEFLEAYFDNLGLRKRGTIIWKFSYQFVSSKWRRASDLCGIGKYGEDAYRIFCLGHTDLDPDDRYLKLYLDWLSRHTEFEVQSGIADSECHIEDLILKYYKISLRNIHKS